MFRKRSVLLLGLLLVIVLAGCSWAGGALLPSVPTRTPGAELTRPVVNAGDYAPVALQPADGTPLVPLVLDVYPEADAGALMTTPGVAGILDANGNGRMEVVVRALRNGGVTATVFAGDGKALLPVVGMECQL